VPLECIKSRYLLWAGCPVPSSIVRYAGSGLIAWGHVAAKADFLHIRCDMVMIGPVAVA